MSTSQFPTGEAGLVNAQQMLLTHLGQAGTPQTGDGGIVNFQNLLQQFLAGGGGSGMVPPGTTGVGAFTTNGTSGLATYSPTSGALNIPNYSAMPAGSTGISALTTSGHSGTSSYSAGALNIPVYASGTLNMQKVLVTTTATTTATTLAAATSINLGLPFTAQVNPCVCLDYSFLVSNSVASMVGAILIVRTIGAIPPLGATVPGGDAILCQTRQLGFLNSPTTLNGTFLDTTLSLNTPYNYYAAAWIGSGSGTLTITATGGTAYGLCAFEVK